MLFGITHAILFILVKTGSSTNKFGSFKAVFTQNEEEELVPPKKWIHYFILCLNERRFPKFGYIRL